MVKQIEGINLYSVDDLQEALGIDNLTLRHLFKTGILQGEKTGGRWYASDESIKAFVLAHDVILSDEVEAAKRLLNSAVRRECRERTAKVRAAIKVIERSAAQKRRLRALAR